MEIPSDRGMVEPTSATAEVRAWVYGRFDLGLQSSYSTTRERLQSRSGKSVYG
ncbi:uncharacterized protein RCO7_10193 [Rhynchosporium graminicola]|uniref:Uncharacterized protein n=1 Tax=Rhynchosporium graminicola TaxID=2792576 RepID=A0A1E1K475_9HELO|nr:uncharacterized protein RCO7_10193 [Rhynchosporium commune]